ncbi:structural maintenance of chromosomes 5 [Anaeramoeba flamelloides]|uniref:Structural maintenance of chromosomes 5 n=1 Tax=Anaeramoeba flamelloides TaxID=1746091 RepID=A0ABQ8YI23_9EUKA|nr:structural maintenance of chromosomes 5 [Anaeramoeba flamelloides]
MSFNKDTTNNSNRKRKSDEKVKKSETELEEEIEIELEKEKEKENSNYLTNTLHDPEETKEELEKKKKRNNETSNGILKDQNFPELPEMNLLKQLEHGTTTKYDLTTGTFKEIYLENFLCHESLRVKFGKHINFIHGKNGSGKSAIMVALLICLSAPTKFTNRGSSLKELIRYDQNRAKIQVLIRNKGVKAYKPSKYGSTIVIERTIYPNRSQYKLMNKKTNKVVSRRTQDLKEILNHFSIHVNNQCVFMTQDTSRTFLNSSTPKETYRFFYEATLLRYIEELLKSCKESFQSTQKVYNKKTADFKSVQKLVVESQARYEAAKDQGKMEERLQQVKEEYAWKLVKEAKIEIEKLKIILSKGIESIQKLSELYLKNKEKQFAFKEKHITYNKEHSTTNDQLKQIHEKIKKLNKKKSQELRKNSGISSKLRNLKEDKERSNKQKQFIETQIRKQNKDAVEEYQKKKRKKEEKLALLQKKIEEQEKLIDEIKQEERKVRNDHKNVKNQINEYKDTINKSHQIIHQHEKQIGIYRKRNHNKIFNFGGDRSKAAHETIQRNKNKFVHPPIGPLGCYIKIIDEKWAFALQTVLWTSLNLFLVDNLTDENVLKQFIKRKYKKMYFIPNCYQMKFKEKKYRIPLPRYRTLLDVVEIDNYIVYNAVMNLGKIYQYALVENYKEGQQKLKGRGNNVPIKCIDPEGTIYDYDGGTLGFVPALSNDLKFTKDYGPLIEQKNRDIEKQKKLIGIEKEKIQDIQQEQNSVKRQIEKITNKLKKLNTAKSKLDRDQRICKNQKIKPPPEVSELEEQIQEYNQKIFDYDRRIEELNNEKKENQPLIQELNQKIKSEQDNAKTVLMQLKKLKGEFAKIKDKGNGITLSIKKNQNKTKKITQNYNKKKKEFTKLVKNYELLYQKATGLTATPYISQKNPNKLHSEEIQLTEKLKIAKEKNDNKSFQEIKKDYLMNKKKLKDIYHCLQNNGKLIQLFKQSHQERVEFHTEIKDSNSMQLSDVFNDFLGMRRLTGYTKTKHDERTLELHLEEEDDDESEYQTKSHTRRTKTFSGGEKSYVTVAFLASLWQLMETPIIVLDEFDIFLDAVNRKIVLDLLIEQAKENTTRQYIFITPQDLKSLKNDKNIKIMQLEDPNRTQMRQQLSQKH